MENTLGVELKRRGVTQAKFSNLLREKYNLSITPQTINWYYNKVGIGTGANWNTIRLCAKQEYGLEYRHGRWMEVNENGN